VKFPVRSEIELMNFELLPLFNFVLGVSHMSNGFPCVFRVVISYPFDKEVGFSIDELLVNNLFDLKRGAVSLIKHC